MGTRRRAGLRVIVLAAAAVLARAAGSPGAAQARTDLIASQTVNRNWLVAMLESGDPFRGQVALEMLAAWPALVDAKVIALLVPQLEEFRPFPMLCMHEVKADSPDEPGVDVARSLCMKEAQTPNGVRAARVLARHAAFPLIVAHVARRPSSVEAVIASLAGSGIGPTSAVLAPLAAATEPAVQQALLRLAIAGPCAPGGALPALEPVVALEASPTGVVRQLASVAVVRLARCGREDATAAEARGRAAASLGARLGDLGDRDVVGQVALLGPQARVLLSPVLARFQRASADHGQRAKLVEIIGAIGPGAGDATATLASILGDRKQTYLWVRTLEALGAIGPDAAAAKPALLGAFGELGQLFLPLVTTTLVRIDARLDRQEFARLRAAYREACGDWACTSLPGSDSCSDCYDMSFNLGRLARRGGHAFRDPNADADPLP